MVPNMMVDKVADMKVFKVADTVADMDLSMIFLYFSVIFFGFLGGFFYFLVVRGLGPGRGPGVGGPGSVVRCRGWGVRWVRWVRWVRGSGVGGFAGTDTVAQRRKEYLERPLCTDPAFSLPGRDCASRGDHNWLASMSGRCNQQHGSVRFKTNSAMSSDHC